MERVVHTSGGTGKTYYEIIDIGEVLSNIYDDINQYHFYSKNSYI